MSYFCKRSRTLRRIQAAIRRIGYGAAAAALLAFVLMLPARSARAEAADDATVLVLVVMAQDESTGGSTNAAGDPEAAQTTVTTDASDTAQPVNTLDTPEPRETPQTAETPEPEQIEPTTAPTAEPTATVEVDAEQAAALPQQSEASVFDCSNEYIFYSNDAAYAADICGRYGGSLLRWSDGVAVMFSTTAPNGGDVVFYPQEIIIVQSAPYYEQQGDSISQIGNAQTLALDAGKGVVIAVIDSGIDLDHPALAGNILQAISVIPSSAYGSGGYFSAAYEGAQDYEGHGSHIAGIIAGQTDDSTIGIAPEAQILSIKALERYGASAAGTTEWLIHAIQYAIAQKVDIINLSIGGSKSYVSAAQVVLQQAADAGILVVCATGNADGGATPANTIDYPAAYDDTLAVTCVTVVGDDITLSGFSRYGEGTDLSAPGVAIYSCNQNGGYSVQSGTSMSCAVVSGIAGLLLSQDASLTPQQIIQLLEQSAHDAGASGYDTMFGWGVVDARAALLLLRHPGGGHHNDLPNEAPATEATLPVPHGTEADAATDWLTTQQKDDRLQEDMVPVDQNGQNSGLGNPKQAGAGWIWASLCGTFGAAGAAWLLLTRAKRRQN